MKTCLYLKKKVRIFLHFDQNTRSFHTFVSIETIHTTWSPLHAFLLHFFQKFIFLNWTLFPKFQIKIFRFFEKSSKSRGRSEEKIEVMRVNYFIEKLLPILVGRNSNSRIAHSINYSAWCLNVTLDAKKS